MEKLLSLNLNSFINSFQVFEPHKFLQLAQRLVQSTNILIDLPKKYLDILESPSESTPFLSKYGAYAVINHKLRNDNFFINNICEIDTFESTAWFLYNYEDGTEIRKTIPSSSPHLLTIPGGYCCPWNIPPAFLIWYRVKVDSVIPNNPKEIFYLYLKHKIAFTLDSVNSSIDPYLYEQYPAIKKDNSNIPPSLDLSNVKSHIQTNREKYSEFSNDYMLSLFLAYDFAVHNPCTVKQLMLLGTSTIDVVRRLTVNLNGKTFPAFPFLCFSALKSFESNYSLEFFNTLSHEMTCEYLIDWYLKEWIPCFPSSYILVDHLTSHEYSHKKLIDKLEINYASVAACWNTHSGLKKNADMTLNAIKLSNKSVNKCDIAEKRTFGFPSVSNKNLIIHVNADDAVLVALRSKCNFNPKRSENVVGFFLWETSTPPMAHELGASIVDNICVPTNFLKEAYENFVNNKRIINVGKSISIKADQCLSDLSNLIPKRILEDKSVYKFLTVLDGGSGVERKNPISLVRAFTDIFSESNSNAHLIVKTISPNFQHWGDPFSTLDKIKQFANKRSDITIIDGFVSDSELLSLISFADAIVSPHRSEGFGYLMIEALFLNKPLICTDYSAFDLPDHSFSGLIKLPYKLIPTPGNKFFHDSSVQFWADPKFSSLKESIKYLYLNRISKFAVNPDEEQKRLELMDYYSERNYLDRLQTILK